MPEGAKGNVRNLLFRDIFEIFSGKPLTIRLVALLSAKLLTLGIIQVYLILHSLIRNIVSSGMTEYGGFSFI